jgi:5'-nucleotidase (lipoprotein e(P4) family)
MTAHNNLHGLLYQATSAEYIALCVQMYQLARHALIDRLRSGTFRHPAVIFDLDETLLDNSAYAAWQIQAGTNFNEATSWKEWCDTGQSGAVPGGIEFVKFAEEAGATPIFITTRLNETRKGTARNLRKLGVLSDAELEAEEKDGKKAEHAFHTRLFMKGMPDAALKSFWRSGITFLTTPSTMDGFSILRAPQSPTSFLPSRAVEILCCKI